MKIDVDWLKRNKYNSVTDYCRKLVDKKVEDEEIEVYRGDVLSYRVLSIYEAAKMVPDGARFVKYKARKRLQDGY